MTQEHKYKRIGIQGNKFNTAFIYDLYLPKKWTFPEMRNIFILSFKVV